ncbi:hypothetical protein NDU88_009188 [Pleurodeles waltl]|uniref:Uncharacterized protein n=1 Tax=Pleurodeles waltl TaxID=8319 RepID=A0AAV7PTV8_PLEWA|nr:hypothetical protein NDU88_009188 [Pleurodeles waltl]
MYRPRPARRRAEAPKSRGPKTVGKSRGHGGSECRGESRGRGPTQPPIRPRREIAGTAGASGAAGDAVRHDRRSGPHRKLSPPQQASASPPTSALSSSQPDRKGYGRGPPSAQPDAARPSFSCSDRRNQGHTRAAGHNSQLHQHLKEVARQ